MEDFHAKRDEERKNEKVVVLKDWDFVVDTEEKIKGMEKNYGPIRGEDDKFKYEDIINPPDDDEEEGEDEVEEMEEKKDNDKDDKKAK